MKSTPTTTTKAPAASNAGTPVNIEPRTLRKIVTEDIVIASLEIPAAVERFLGFGPEGFCDLPSASARTESCIELRISQWKLPHTVGTGRRVPAHKKNLKLMLAALEKEPSVQIKIVLDLCQWECIQEIVRRLKITPGDWLLACVAYSAINAGYSQKLPPAPAPLEIWLPS